MSARALEWGILNASRFQEIAGARRREVDLLLKRWTIPPERMKREIEHVVPLSDEAISLFKSLPPGNPDDLLFPAPEGGQLSDSALGAMIDGIHESDLARGGTGYMDPKEGRIATQHGFRSTFRDRASEVGYFDREIVEHAIAHKLKDKAEAAYQRGTLLMKRAFIMAKWGAFCSAPVFVAHVDLRHLASGAGSQVQMAVCAMIPLKAAGVRCNPVRHHFLSKTYTKSCLLPSGSTATPLQACFLPSADNRHVSVWL
jgi:hypothetical protein